MVLVINKVLAIFLLIAAGYFVGKIKVLPDGADKTLNILLIQMITPCMILSSITSKELTDDTFTATIQTLVGAALFFVLAGIVGFLFSKYVLRIRRGAEVGVWAYSFGSVNTGFMGFPVTLALFGQDIFYLIVMHNVVLTVYLYSAGPSMIKIGEKHSETTSVSSEQNRLKTFFKSFANPNAVASLIALIMLFCGLHLPTTLFESVKTLGDATIPLSMLLVGIQLSESDLLSIIKNGKILAFSLVKMLLLPVLVFLCVNWLPLSAYVKTALIFAAVFPSAVATAPVCAMEGKDSLTAAKLVAITTLLSVATIPLFAMFLTDFYLG